jgi:hypothetical protein
MRNEVDVIVKTGKSDEKQSQVLRGLAFFVLAASGRSGVRPLFRPL